MRQSFLVLMRFSWNLLRELGTRLPIILGDSTILRENIYTLSSVSRRTDNQKSTKIGEPLTKNLRKLENRRLSCQSFSEILRISEIVWPETHQNLPLVMSVTLYSLKVLQILISPHPVWNYSLDWLSPCPTWKNRMFASMLTVQE
jgi:hypothetical protein